MNELTPKREKEILKLVREIDVLMAPLRKIQMSRELVILNERRAKFLNELFQCDFPKSYQ